jgi:deferrochelatase/peroxidase EfeB
VQAIIFSGMKKLRYSTCLVMTLPEAANLGEWLSWVRGDMLQLDAAGAPGSGAMLSGLLGSGVVVPVTRDDGSIEGYSLAHSLTLTFGDRPLVGDASLYDTAPSALDPSDLAALGKADARAAMRRAVFLACSARGMARFSPPNAAGDMLLGSFPPAFQMGMAERGRSLGDLGPASSDHWRWDDGKAEAAMLVYAESPEDLAYAAQVHRALIENYGGMILNQTDCAPARADDPQFEHFGYRDGISQPIIRGTGRATRDAPVRDLVEPGDFILGYANGQGLTSPSPAIGAESDLGHNLPVLSKGDLGRFPDFGDKHFGSAPRDFGRNGSFIVIRELAQDVDGFESFVARKADELRGAIQNPDQPAYRDLYKLIGQYPDKDWIKAKLMGRWPNGRPLIGNPVNAPSPAPGDPDEAACRAREVENDFTYGSDDPQGLACPFGSHIRRTNPRDSKQPGDKEEQAITNRHRLLRRGRTYSKSAPNGATEKGLLFVSLCADLERQFEFVQQAWSNASSFHGLTNEPDPIFGADTPDVEKGGVCPRNFTIPTPAGPLKLTGMENFVSVKAGGYFFLPSRSALSWMTDVAQPGAQAGAVT